MKTLTEKAEKLFRRIGPLKVTDEEIMRLADVPAEEVENIRIFLNVFTRGLVEDTAP